MDRIVISCIILLISIHYSCLASSEIPTAAGNRFKRATLGINFGFTECAHIGSTCAIYRDKEEKPTKVVATPCCDYLYCAGIGPNDVKNGLGQAIRADGLSSSGICTLSLDNNQGPKDHDEYVAYVKSL